MHHVFCASTVQMFCGHAKFAFSLLDIAGSHGFTYLSNVLTYDGLERSIASPVDDVLT
jgi:hypothetical protein